MIDDDGREHEMPDGSLSEPEIKEQNELESRYFHLRNGRTEVELTPKENDRFRELNRKGWIKCETTMLQWVKTKPRPVCCQHCAGFWDRWSALYEGKEKV